MLTDRTIEKVMIVLRKKYEKKGTNFVFKSKQISVPDFANQTVGQVLAEAVKRGYPVDYYKKPKGSITIWKTTFGDKE